MSSPPSLGDYDMESAGRLAADLRSDDLRAQYERLLVSIQQALAWLENAGDERRARALAQRDGTPEFIGRDNG